MEVGLARMPLKPAGPHQSSFPQGGPPPGEPSRLPLLGGTGLQSPRTGYGVSPSPLQATDSSSLPQLSQSRSNKPAGRDPQFEDMFALDKRKKQPGRTKTILSQAQPHRLIIADDEKPKHFNTEPLPFQSQTFNGPPLQKVQIVGVGVSLPNLGATRETRQRHLNRSSTMMKKVSTSKRHGEMWMGQDTGRHRGFIVHTDRYQWDGYGRILDSPSQRDRLQAEYEYMERLRGIKRRREMVPHRESYDFLMGGQKVSLNERMDIMRELNQLKSVVLPTKAKDLYVGRGFAEKLPMYHALNNPRGKTVVSATVTQSAPSAPGRAPTRFPIIRLPKPKPPAKPSLHKNKSSLGGLESKLFKNKYRMPPVNLHHASVLSQDTGRGGKLVIHPPTGPRPEQQATMGRHSEPIKDSTWPKEQATAATGDEVRPRTSDVNTGPDDNHPISRLSPAKSVSPIKAATPNPLMGLQIEANLAEDELESLRRTFKRLDTDADGHLMFQQLQSQLPNELSKFQENFVKQVYEISNKSTFFGVDEFVSLSVLCKRVVQLEGEAAEAYDGIDYTDLSTTIIQYVELFQSVDRTQTGKLSHDALREVLSTARDTEISSDKYEEIRQLLKQFGEEEVSKMDYIILIPYFLSLKL